LAVLGSDADVARLAISLLDLTDLGDDTTADAAEALCKRARDVGVAAVCIWPAYVSVCVDALSGTDIRVATVVNFPSGEEPDDDVAAMTRQALADGADEIDVVLPYRPWLRGEDARAGRLLDLVRGLVTDHADHSAGPGIVKVIIESGELPDQAAIDRATHFAIAHGADFVKTSSGKTPVSATLEAAEIILEAIELTGLPVGFKASGGIRTVADARDYLELAERIMGDGWISMDTFRFGASGVLDSLVLAAGDS
jgi:deoxyribose-phosphate aldolase